MSTPIIFVGTAPTPTTGADTTSHGPHDAASIDQNMANLRSVLDGKCPVAGPGSSQAFSVGALAAGGVIDATIAGIKMVRYTPTSSEGGGVGTFTYDDNYIYLCVAVSGANSWKRAALSTY